MLIGVDFLYPMMGTNIRKDGGYLAIETVFGYFLCGTGRHSEVLMYPRLGKVSQSEQEARKRKLDRESVVSLAAAIKTKVKPRLSVLGANRRCRKLKRWLARVRTRQRLCRNVGHIRLRQGLADRWPEPGLFLAGRGPIDGRESTLGDQFHGVSRHLAREVGKWFRQASAQCAQFEDRTHSFSRLSYMRI